MDLKRLQTFDALKPVQTPQVGGTNSTATEVGGTGPSFKSTLEQLTEQSRTQPSRVPTLDAKSVEGVKFSNHAVERMKTRGINYSPDDLERLNQAVSKAAAKGSRDSLVLMNDSALIVSVKNNTVVTVMDKAALKENVFTNIDSTVVL
ncbi:MAG: TIGR02530 family flagellar biosynthesis protein [Bdellovibrionia bacterium]